MANFAKLAATAKRLIEKNGRTVQLYKRLRDAADPAQPWRGTTKREVDGIAVLACFVPAQGSGFGNTVETGAGQVQTFTELCLIAASSMPAGTELSTFDTLVDNERAWGFVIVDKLQPAAVPLVYALGLRS